MGVLLGGDLARSGIILSEEDEDGLYAQLSAVRPAPATPRPGSQRLYLIPGHFPPLLSRKSSLATKAKWTCWGDSPLFQDAPASRRFEWERMSEPRLTGDSGSVISMPTGR